MKTCERCGKSPDPQSYSLLDYCLYCSKDLCPECMAKGCCDHVPAVSGSRDDATDED